MNSEDQDKKIDDETSRNLEESSSIIEDIFAQINSSAISPENSHNQIASNTQSGIVSPNSTEKNIINNLFVKPIDQSNTNSPTTDIVSTAPNPSQIFLRPENNDMKRASAKELIERYFYQVLDGCGKGNCENKCCASSGEIDKLTPNQAAARAIQLFSQDAKLCDVQPPKIARTSNLETNIGDCGQSTSASTPSSSSSQMLIDNNDIVENNLDIYRASTSKEAESYFQNDCNDSLLDSHSPKLSPNASSRLPQSSSSHKIHDDLTTAASSSNVTTPSSHHSRYSSSNSNATNSLPPLVSNSEILKNSEITDKKSQILDEKLLNDLIAECQSKKTYTKLICRLGQVFSSVELLSKSFLKEPNNKIKAIVTESTDLTELKKEDLRELQGETDKDEDSSVKCNDHLSDCVHFEEDDTIFDLISFRRSMQHLFTIDFSCYEALNNGLHSLSILLGVDLRMVTDKEAIEKIVQVFVLIFELMTIALSEFLDNALPNICRAASYLPIWAQAKLARIWAKNCRSSLKSILETLQQLISIQAITNSLSRCVFVENNEKITNATKILKILYYANILTGVLETPYSVSIGCNEVDIETENLNDTTDDNDDYFDVYSHVRKSLRKKVEDNLQKELGITVTNSRTPVIPFDEFYNEPLSDAIEMNNDYLYYHSALDPRTAHYDKKFTFLLHSFILTPATKATALYYDSRMRMMTERTLSLGYYVSENSDAPNPYLKLKVRRDKLIDDALVELEVIAMCAPKDFKKQLVVEFIGEQGIDEGGVSKEFFQLVVEEIFNPDFGMFTYQEDTNTVWFNPTSFENEAQFTLIGIVLGLAIYNNIILAVNFPMVVYRKLLGERGTFYDLKDWNPVLFNSLKQMLDYENDDMEEVFMQTFKISYTDVFGNNLNYELKNNGDDIFVNQNNKIEFIELYSEFLLNGSIDKQFKAFKKGFDMVTDESPLKLLFRPEEIEILVCGSREFNFDELEKSTEYEGGFVSTSQTIIDFWNIVHNLPIESKRKLLEFTTGSDRVPVGGLSRLKLVIARNGPDSDRLPTSHTCFNVLLLPEYSSKDKLEDRLLKAINYSKGFGML